MSRSETTWTIRRGRDEFAVRRHRARGRTAFVGYFNGSRSVTAAHRHVAVRVLLLKHVLNAEPAQVIDFKSAKERLK